MDTEQTPPTQPWMISLSDNRVIVKFDGDGMAGIQVGPKVSAGSLYAIAAGIEHERLIVVYELPKDVHSLVIDIAEDGEPMARAGQAISWYDMFAVAGVFRLQADIRMSKAIMNAEAKAASLGIVVPGSPS
jgi:hypothetical protein